MKKLKIKCAGMGVLACLFLPASAMAHSWSCEHNNLIREVTINSEAENAVPCSVEYTKVTEGVATQVLWSADNTAGYCEEKAEAFVAKLESWGWSCAAEPDSEPVTEPEPAAEQPQAPSTPEIH